MNRRLERNLLLALLGAALAGRVVFFLAVRGLDVVTVPLLDSQAYHEWALRLLAGNWDWYQTYWLAPLYPHLLALVYLVAGPRIPVMVALQLGLNILNVLLVWMLGRRALSAGDPRPLLAALLYAGYGAAVFYAGQLLAATLLTTLVLLIALQALRVIARPTTGGLLVLGLLLGLASVGRGNFLLPAFAAAAWVLWRGMGRLPRLRAAGVLTAGVLLVILPVTARNIIVAGDFTLLTSNAGLNLLIGQQARYRGIFAHVSEDPEADFDPTREHALEQETGRDLSGGQVSGMLTRQAMRLFLRDWKAMPLHYLRKVYRFWNGYELPQIISFGFWRARLPVLWLFPVPFLLFAAAGLPGLPTVPRPARDILLWLIGTYFLSLLPFFPTARYRLPLVPLLAVPAAGVLWSLVRREPGWPRRLGTVAALAVALWPAWASISAEEVEWQAHLHNAARAAVRGDPAAVITEGNLAEQARPGLAETPYQVARQLEITGTWRQAVDLLHTAAARAPDQKIIPYRIGRDLEQAGDAAGALGAYAAAAARDTTWHLPHLRAGLLLRKLGRPAESLDELHLAHDLAPGDRQVRTNLASLLAETGRLEEARSMLLDLVRDEPRYVNGWFNLALVEWNAGHENAARTALARAARLKNLTASQRAQVDQLRRLMQPTRERS